MPVKEADAQNHTRGTNTRELSITKARTDTDTCLQTIHDHKK